MELTWRTGLAEIKRRAELENRDITEAEWWLLWPQLPEGLRESIRSIAIVPPVAAEAPRAKFPEGSI